MDNMHTTPEPGRRKAHPLPIYMRPNGFRAFTLAPAASIPTPVLECLGKYPHDECRMTSVTYRTTP